MTNSILGFLAPAVIYFVITVLHIIIPTKKIDGYVTHEVTGNLLQYRINGKWVAIATALIWYALGKLDIVSYGWLYEVRWEGLAGACTLGLIYSFVMVIGKPSTGKPFLADLFLGRLWNPQWKDGLLDHKMWLYMVGATMLFLNVLSFTSYHFITFGEEANYGVLLCAGLITYFIFDYFTFEHVHVYTYDIFAERVGYKLGWGCLTFYPYFYTVALWYAADKPNPGIENWQLILAAVVFFTGWSLARGANMQKFFFKRNPNKSFLGIQPESITDGNKTLLVNGFWGVSRHVNYLGEILMGTGIALAVGFPMNIWPWLYPIYYVALLFPRQMDDDKICADKYGDLWNAYTSKVKYKIIPWVY